MRPLGTENPLRGSGGELVLVGEPAHTIATS
jgi:hypothetical protein